MIRSLSKQKIRFLIAGCFNTGLDFLMLNALTILLAYPILFANSISVTVGICVSYILNHFFVFRYPYKISWRKFGLFFLITGFSSLVIQNLIIFGFEALANTQLGNSILWLPSDARRGFIVLNFAKVLAVLAGLIWNYTFYRFTVFRIGPHIRAAEDK